MSRLEEDSSDIDYDDCFYDSDLEDESPPMINDPEDFDGACLTETEAKNLLNESVE